MPVEIEAFRAKRSRQIVPMAVLMILEQQPLNDVQPAQTAEKPSQR
jgi:hypothetical protein